MQLELVRALSMLCDRQVVLLEVRLLQLLRGHLRGHEVGSSLDSVALLALLLHLLDRLLVRDLHLRVIGRVVDLGVL